MIQQQQSQQYKLQYKQRPRYAQMIAQRKQKCTQQFQMTGLVVLQRFRISNPQYLYYFTESRWDTRQLPQDITQPIISKIIKAKVQAINFSKVIFKFSIPITIISQLSLVIFQNLQKLDLPDNFITTIQNLPSLRAPKLEQLNLNNNLITSIQSLRKCCFPQLIRLNLKKNIIVQYDKLAQILQNKLQILILHQDSKEQIQNWWRKVAISFYQPIPDLLLQPTKMKAGVYYFPPTQYLFKRRKTSIMNNKRIVTFQGPIQ